METILKIYEWQNIKSNKKSLLWKIKEDNTNETKKRYVQKLIILLSYTNQSHFSVISLKTVKKLYKKIKIYIYLDTFKIDLFVSYLDYLKLD